VIKQTPMPNEIRLTDIVFSITSKCKDCDLCMDEPDDKGHICIYEWDDGGVPGESCPDPAAYNLILGRLNNKRGKHKC